MPLSRGDLYVVAISGIATDPSNPKYRLVLVAGTSKVHIRKILLSGWSEGAAVTGFSLAVKHAASRTAGSEAEKTPLNLNGSASAAATATAWTTTGTTDVTLVTENVIGGIEVPGVTAAPAGGEQLLEFEPGELTLVTGECVGIESSAGDGKVSAAIFFQEGD